MAAFGRRLVSTDTFAGQTVTVIKPEALRHMAAEAIRDISHLLRPGHLAQLRRLSMILKPQPMIVLLLWNC